MVRHRENGGQKDCAQMWFGPDFRGSLKVQAMTWAEQGMYRHLLDLAFENFGIPADLEDLRGILKLSPNEFAATWKKIGKCFVPKPGDPSALINERQERERAIRAEIRQKRAQAGERGNEKRWGGRNSAADDSHSDRKSDTDANDLPANGAERGDANASQNPRLSPSPPPSPSPVPPSPAGPEKERTSSRCTGDDQQDDRAAGSGPAGLSGNGRALWEALRKSSYRKHSANYELELLAACERLDKAGITPDDLVELARRARRKKGVRDPERMFAHWIDHVDEALKEIGKR